MKLNRRQFLAASVVMGVTTTIYIKGQKVTFFDEKIQILIATCKHLYPTSPLGLGIDTKSFMGYMLFVLDDERIMPDDRAYLLRGATWLEEHSQELYTQSYLTLDAIKRETLLRDASEYQWGYSYISYLFNYIFEAIFSAPVYGTNNQGEGWKFVNHQAGFPQPKTQKDISYAL